MLYMLILFLSYLKYYQKNFTQYSSFNKHVISVGHLPFYI